MAADKTHQDALLLAKRLRHHTLLKNRPGVLNGKRVDFFKAKHALRVLQDRSFYTAEAPDANAVFSLLLRYKLIQRVDKLSSRTERQERSTNSHAQRRIRRLRISAEQSVAEKAYFVWLYDQIPVTTVFLGIAALLLVLAVIVYPLWPPRLRRMAYRLSWVALGLVVLLLIITILRLCIFIITLALFPPGIWLFPNLYEDVGFIDSFRPLWSWHVKRKNKRKVKKSESKEKAASGSEAVSTSMEREYVKTCIEITNFLFKMKNAKLVFEKARLI
ncbi:hypothetical protein PORY_002539 [Pneumocystis oryctolagi]|uniref:Uncharacterized protein n=1 Tax=Pneumocystis oryctolagi TaxID=42067 RepID=A0ACB7C932_9ASCO|nr:hypothetical protein PORY_002539 [Pneumocystis oryctolagi]